MSTLKTANIQDTSGNNNSTPEQISQGRAKAWVNFNGIGTVAIRKSYNVSSITDNAEGRYRINFTTAFADADYVIVVTSDRANAPSNIGIITTNSENAPTTSNYSFRFCDVTSFVNTEDQNYFYAVVFDD